MRSKQIKSIRWHVDGCARGLALYVLRLYRRHISHILSTLQGSSAQVCRFIPSCSAYAEGAFTKKSFFPAAYLTIRRVMACRPRSRSGFDPIV